MFSYKPNAICMAGMTMPVGAGHAASHCWNRVRKPRQLINYARFWPQWWTFAKNRTAHAQTHYRKSTQWQWASFVSVPRNSHLGCQTHLFIFAIPNNPLWLIPGCLCAIGSWQWYLTVVPQFNKCDPSHQNRAVVGRMHFKILLHLYGKKQRK